MYGRPKKKAGTNEDDKKNIDYGRETKNLIKRMATKRRNASAGPSGLS